MARKPIDIPIVVEAPAETDTFIKGLWRQNPVFVQVLGMCPTLAVTNTAVNALAMGLATSVVLVISSVVVSSLRGFIPKQVRIASYILVIASLVTGVDYVIQAISLELHSALGAFISLIVVNCLILSRAEAFAAHHSPRPALLDAAGMAVGFTCALLALGMFRELLGKGALFGVAVLPERFEPWVVMLLPGGGFFALGLLLLIFNRIRETEGAAKR